MTSHSVARYSVGRLTGGATTSGPGSTLISVHQENGEPPQVRVSPTYGQDGLMLTSQAPNPPAPSAMPPATTSGPFVLPELAALLAELDRLSTAPAPAPAPVMPPAAPSESRYTVQPGDTLGDIAGRELGDRSRWGEIYDLNRGQLSDPNAIRTGQSLRMPPGDRTAPRSQPPAPSGRVPADPNSYHMTQFYHPRWNPQGPNASSNCGPASLAMALKAFGLQPPGVTSSTNVEQFIDKTRRVMTGNENDQAYTNLGQLKSGAEKSGAKAAYIESVSGVEKALSEGKLVAVAGNPAAYSARFKSEGMFQWNGGHMILVTGQKDGRFLVNDPLSKTGSISLSRDELARFMGYQGWNDGVAIWP